MISGLPNDILLVCDGDDAETLGDLLGGAGYRLSCAPDLATAQPLLKRLAGEALVLIDDSAPGDLVGFLGFARQLLNRPRLPVVLMVAGDGNGPAGVTEVVVKPYDPPLLLEVIQRLLERR